MLILKIWVSCLLHLLAQPAEGLQASWPYSWRPPKCSASCQNSFAGNGRGVGCRLAHHLASWVLTVCPALETAIAQAASYHTLAILLPFLNQPILALRLSLWRSLLIPLALKLVGGASRTKFLQVCPITLTLGDSRLFVGVVWISFIVTHYKCQRNLGNVWFLRCLPDNPQNFMSIGKAEKVRTHVESTCMSG